MTYVVFARKYRPQKFEDIVAQEHVTRTLRNAVRNNRVGSGYLFCGPRGTGKTTTARILAKALNCVNGPTPDPCGECPTCLEIAGGSSLDVLEIDAASNTGVDDVRTLRENVRYLPTGGKKRIYIIDEVHRLSGAAFDALLKTLEEPPEHVMFVFATTEPLKVPETILSRTQRFDFKRVSVNDLAEHLKKVAELEKLDIDSAAIRLLARKADGSVRDSLSLLDQIAAFTGGSINEKEIIEALGLVDRRFLFDFTTAVASRESQSVLKHVAKVFSGGIDPKDFVSELLEHLRVLLILAIDKESGELLDFSEEELSEYSRQIDYFSVGDIIRLMKMAADLNRELKDSGLDERLLLEMTAVKMAEMESTVKFEDVLEMMKQNRQGAATADADLFGLAEKKKNEPAVDSSVVDAGEAKGTAASSVQPVYTRAVNLPMLKAGWNDFLAILRQKRPMLASHLGMTEIREVRDNKVLLVYPASGEDSRRIVEKPANLSLITTALREHFRASLSIRLEINRNRGTPAFSSDLKSRPGIDVKELLDNSPRIRKLLEKVDGEIVGVKKIE